MLRPITAALILAALPIPAFAAQDAGDEIDKPVTEAEIRARLDADYADMDADKDGKLTAAEIEDRLAKSAQAKIDALRKERDAAFARLDTNGDGSISRAEFDEKARLPTVKPADAKPFLDRFDSDKDGTVSLSEFRSPTLANFARMDADKNGTVTPAEAKLAAIPPRAAPAASGATGPEASPPASRKKPAVKSTPPIRKEPEGR